MDAGLFTQVVYMQEWFDLAQKECDLIKTNRNVNPLEKLVTIINGQFFSLMKLLNENKTNYNCTGKSKHCKKTKKNSHLRVSYILETPFPSLLIYELSWPSSDIKAVDTFQVLAALPPFFFIPTAYSLD